MIEKHSYFRTRAMQVDLGFVNSICYLKTLRVTLKIEVKKKKGEVFGFLFLTSLQNDACQ